MASAMPSKSYGQTLRVLLGDSHRVRVLGVRAPSAPAVQHVRITDRIMRNERQITAKNYDRDVILIAVHNALWSLKDVRTIYVESIVLKSRAVPCLGAKGIQRVRVLA
jgi:hypothetical protein